MGVTIGEVLMEKGMILVYEVTEDGRTTIKSKKPKHLYNRMIFTAPKCLALMKPHFKKLEEHNKEQMQKAIINGCDPDYILKSSKEMGDKEPVFEWNNKGMLEFVSRKDAKKKAA